MPSGENRTEECVGYTVSMVVLSCLRERNCDKGQPYRQMGLDGGSRMALPARAASARCYRAVNPCSSNLCIRLYSVKLTRFHLSRYCYRRKTYNYEKRDQKNVSGCHTGHKKHEKTAQKIVGLPKTESVLLKICHPVVRQAGSGAFEPDMPAAV